MPFACQVKHHLDKAMDAIGGLEKVCAGTVETSRLQFLMRYLNIASATCKLYEELEEVKGSVTISTLKCSQRNIDLAIALHQNKSSYMTWMESAEKHFPLVNKDWNHDTKEGDTMVGAVDTLLLQLMDAWWQWACSVKDSLAAKSPPQGLADSPGLLASNTDRHRKTLGTAIQDLTQSGLMSVSGDAANLIYKLEQEGMVPEKTSQCRRDILKLRKEAKRAICVEWAITEVLGFKPDSGSSMIEFVTKVTSKLEGEGVPKEAMPSFLVKILQDVKSRGMALKEEEALKEKEATASSAASAAAAASSQAAGPVEPAAKRRKK